MPPFTSGKAIDSLARLYDRDQVKDILQVMQAGMDDTVIGSLSRRYDYATVKEFLSLMPPFTSGKAIDCLASVYNRNQIKELLPVMKAGVDPSVINGLTPVYNYKQVKYFLSGLLPPFTSGTVIDSLRKRFDNHKGFDELMPVMKAGIDDTVIDSLSRRYDYATVKEFLSLMPPFTSGKAIDSLAKGYWFITGVK